MANGQTKTQNKYLKAYQELVGSPLQTQPEENIEFSRDSSSLNNKSVFLKAYEDLVGKPSSPENNPESKKQMFDETAFNNSIGSISLNTRNALSKFYNTDNIEVIAHGGIRSMQEQSENVEKGASKAAISLHNFGAAADFVIKIDGKTIKGTGKDSSLEESTEPYKILGAEALKEGMFWGWKWDSGHVGQTRFVNQFIDANPDQAFSPAAKEYYELTKETAPLTAKPLLDTLDRIYGQQYNREYVGEERTLDELLEPVYVDTMANLSNYAESKTTNKTDEDNLLMSEVEKVKSGKSQLDFNNFKNNPSTLMEEDIQQGRDLFTSFETPSIEAIPESTFARTQEDETNKEYITENTFGLTKQEVESIATDVRTNGWAKYNGQKQPSFNLEEAYPTNNADIIKNIYNAQFGGLVNAPEKTGLDIWENMVRTHFRDEVGDQYSAREGMANIVMGLSEMAVGMTTYTKLAGEAVFMPEKFPEFAAMTGGMLQMLFIDEPLKLIKASGISPSAPIGSKEQADALKEIWRNPIAPLAWAAGARAMPRQFRGARAQSIDILARAEGFLQYLDDVEGVNKVVELDPKVSKNFTPEDIAYVEALRKSPKPFKKAIRNEIDKVKQLENNFAKDSGTAPKPKKTKKTEPNPTLPLDEPLNPNPPKPTPSQIKKAKRAEKTRFDKRRELELSKDQSMLVDSLIELEKQLAKDDLPGGRRSNYEASLERTKKLLLEVQNEMVNRGMNVVEYLEAGFPLTKAQAQWVANRVRKGGQLAIGKMRRKLQAGVEAGPFRFSKNNPFWTPETDAVNAKLAWQAKQQRLNVKAADKNKVTWDKAMEALVDINWTARKRILQSNASDAAKEFAIANLELVRGTNSASQFELVNLIKKVEDGLTPKDVDIMQNYIQLHREVELYRRNKNIVEQHPAIIKKLEKQKRTPETTAELKKLKKELKNAQVYEHSISFDIDPVTLKRKKDSNGKYIVEDAYTTVSKYQQWLKGVQLENPLIHERAMMVFDQYKKNLDELYDAGIFTDKKYKTLNMYDYQRKAYIEKKIEKWNGEYKSLGSGAITVNDDFIRALKKGNPGALDNNYKVLMADALNTKYALLFENRANQALASLINDVPDNGFAKIINKGDKIDADWKVIEYKDKGVSKKISLSPDVYGGWTAQNPSLIGNWANMFQWLSGTKIVKSMATGYNPEFALINFARDIAYTFMRSDVYSSNLYKYAKEMGSDLIATFNDARFKTGSYIDYMYEGGGVSLLSNQGQSRFNFVGANNKTLIKNKGVMRRKIETLKEYAGALGETSEIWVRLAIRNRALRNGMNPILATHAARSNLDFNMAGYGTRVADNVVPYLKAGMAATTSMARGMKKQGLKTSAFKAGQIASAATAVWFSNRFFGKDEYEQINDYEKYNNLVYILPYTQHTNKDSLKVADYTKFPLDTASKIIVQATNLSLEMLFGDGTKEMDMIDEMSKTISELSPVELSTSMIPMIGAAYGAAMNKNSYTKYQIYTQDVKVDDKYKITNKESETARELADFANGMIEGTNLESFGISPAVLQNTLDELAISNNSFYKIIDEALVSGKVAAGSPIKSYKNKQYDRTGFQKLTERFYRETSGVNQNAIKRQQKSEKLIANLQVENTHGVNNFVEDIVKGRKKEEDFVDFINFLKDDPNSFSTKAELTRLQNIFDKAIKEKNYLTRTQILVEKNANKSVYDKAFAVLNYVNFNNTYTQEEKNRAYAELQAVGFMSKEVQNIYGLLLEQEQYKEQLVQLFGKDAYEEMLSTYKDLKVGR